MKRILAVDPTPRGFGFAVIEDEPLRLIDWRVVECRRSATGSCAERLLGLILDYEPSLLVTEGCSGQHARRCRTTHPFLKSVAKITQDVSIPLATFSPEEIRRAFALRGAFNKQQVAHLIAEGFPELARQLPKPRKAWMSEDYRMAIFDAVALGVTSIKACHQ